jgi:hypothetical protein
VIVDVVPVVVAGVTLTEAVAEPLFIDAVTVAVWLAVTVPAVAVKLAEVAPAATVAEAGTAKAALLLESVTLAPPEAAAWDRVTVQLEVPPEVTEVGEHCKAEGVTVAVGVIVSDAAAEVPLSDAVTVADWFDVTVPAVAAKLAVVELVATVTDDGTVSAELLEERATAAPPVGAAAEIVTVHVELAPDVRLVVVHWSAEIVGGALLLMVPPLPGSIKSVPSPKVPITLLIETAPPVLLEARVAVTTATTPLLMLAVLMPLATQVRDPVAELQFSVLPAAVSAGPAAALTLLMPAGYESVHSRPAGALLPPFKERFRETELPGAADPEARLKD